MYSIMYNTLYRLLILFLLTCFLQFLWCLQHAIASNIVAPDFCNYHFFLHLKHLWLHLKYRIMIHFIIVFGRIIQSFSLYNRTSWPNLFSVFGAEVLHEAKFKTWCRFQVHTEIYLYRYALWCKFMVLFACSGYRTRFVDSTSLLVWAYFRMCYCQPPYCLLQVHSIREAVANNLKRLAKEFGPEWAMQHIITQVNLLA